jgi:hypothetical protein
MRWVGHVVSIADRRVAYRFWLGNLRAIDHLDDLHIDGRIILEWIIKCDKVAQIGLICLRTGTSDGLF